MPARTGNGQPSLSRQVSNTPIDFVLTITVDAQLCEPIEATAAIYNMPGNGVAWPQSFATTQPFTLQEAGTTIVRFTKGCSAAQFDVVTGPTPVTITPLNAPPLLFPGDLSTAIQYWGNSARCSPESTTTSAAGPTTTTEPITTSTTSSTTTSTSTTTTTTSTTTTAPPPPEPAALFLLIDEDGIDNGPRFWNDDATTFGPSTIRSWTEDDVNDDRPGLAQRAPLRWFTRNVGSTFWLSTGQVGDEGWFAPKSVPSSWTSAGPTGSGLRNFLGDPAAAAPYGVGPGLGTGSDPESRLDKVPHVIPLRGEGLWGLRGRTVCALVWDSDISINYDQGSSLGINGGLQGEKLGVVAFKVSDAVYQGAFSSSTLPRVRVTVRDAVQACNGPLALYGETPEPASSSEPADLRPGNNSDDAGYAFVTR